MRKETIIQSIKIDSLLEKSSYGKICKGSNESTGTNGCAFELAVKKALKSKSINISAQNRTDVRFTYNGKMVSCEIKSGGGELFKVDENGNAKDRKIDFFIYVDRFETVDDLDFAIVLAKDEFLELAKDLKLIRVKRSTAMQKEYKAGNNWYYDRVTMQSPCPARQKNFNELMSNGKLFIELLEELGR